MIDPHTFPIEADLSRADVVELHRLCSGKDVVEFGAGGSTVLFSKCCKSVVSYEHDRRWLELTRRRLAREALTNAKLVTLPNWDPPKQLPKADVYFIDGRNTHRAKWANHVLQLQVTRVVAVHDSRRSDIMKGYGFLLQCPLMLHLDRIEFHPGNSNLLVIYPREESVAWENWNVTERENRLPHLHKQRR